MVLITGCSSGFGKLAALGFARRGDTVFATMRNVAKAGALREAAAAEGLTLEILQLDVTDRASVDRAVAEVIARAGRIDVAVNNAGIGAVAAVEDFDDDEYLRVFDTNVFGAIRVTRAVLPHMRKQRSGRIINVGSLSGVVPSHFRGIYSATKSALGSLTEALFYELHPFGIHASVIEPGFFATEIGANRMETRRQASSDYAPLLAKYEPGGSSAPEGSKRVDPQPVVDAILEAAFEEHPKRHYAVGNDAVALTDLRKRLPDEEFAQLVLRSMPTLDDQA
ncbi:MAG: SDR family oxidoreductase [Chloroflexi bacterium]|nr:SDR family oxidoreductase [Chloroflexota bacterium]